MRATLRTVGLALLAVGLLACADPAGLPGSDGAVCQRGAARLCTCPDGTPSQQLCQSQSLTWGACEACPSADVGGPDPSDAGSDVDAPPDLSDRGDAEPDGGDAEPDGGASEAVEMFLQACDEAADFWCESAAGCVDGVFVCERSGEALRQLCQDSIPGLQQGRTRLDPTGLDRCLDEIASWQCSIPFRVGPLLPAACQDLLEGVVPLGEPCYPSDSAMVEECAEGFCERTEASPCPGVCAPYRQLGESCSAIPPLRRCAPGLFCDLEQSTCTERPGEGERCIFPADCQDGLTCDGPIDSSRCQPVAGLGESCAVAICDLGLTCQEGQCVERAPLGAPCLAALCVDGASCHRQPVDLVEGVAVCTTTPGEGDACSPLTRAACGTDLVCVSDDTGEVGTCRTPPEAGEACSLLAPCVAGYWCRLETTTGTCEPIGSDGDDCTEGRLGTTLADRGCESGHCAADGRCHPLAQAAGDPCNPTRLDSCPPDLWCDRVTGACQPPVGPGALCNPLQLDRPCDEGYVCDCTDVPGCQRRYIDPLIQYDSERCVVKYATSSECTSNAQCASGGCDPVYVQGLGAGLYQCLPFDPRTTACHGP